MIESKEKYKIHLKDYTMDFEWSSRDDLIKLRNDINAVLGTDNSSIIETKDLGVLSWHDAMAAVGNDPDWRLPTIDELEWIYQNQDKIDKPFDAVSYWSSTEDSATHACTLSFNTGIQYSITNAYTLRSRVIRRDQFDGTNLTSWLAQQGELNEIL